MGSLCGLTGVVTETSRDLRLGRGGHGDFWDQGMGGLRDFWDQGIGLPLKAFRLWNLKLGVLHVRIWQGSMRVLQRGLGGFP